MVWIWMAQPQTYTRPCRKSKALSQQIVADGMSHVGYGINGGSETLAAFQVHFIESYKIDMNKTSNFSTNLFKENAYLPPPPGYESNTTQLRMDIAISGYGYKANNIGYQLALALFYVYSLIAIAHIIYRLSKGKVSTAWEDFLELLVLAQNSPPALHALDDTSGGIKQHRTYRKRAFIRVVETQPKAPEYDKLALVFDEDGKVSTRPQATGAD